MLYACDRAYWRHSDALRSFAGLKVAGSAAAAADFPELRLVNIERRADLVRFDRWASIGDGGNSGFQALNLAVQMGATRIALVGFDMTLARGVHWHGRHVPQLTNPREALFERWRAAFDNSAPILQSLGVVVVNASLQSALEAFPKRPLEDLIR